MTWMDVLIQVIEILFSLVLTVGIPCITGIFIRKTNNEKLKEIILRLEGQVSVAVRATTQTFVEQMKKDGRFDEEAQKEAFNMTKNSLLNMISEDMKIQIIKLVGDFDVYIKNLIESEVNWQK